MQDQILIISLLSILGLVLCQNLNEIDINDGLKQLGINEEIPSDLEERLNNTKLPKVEDVENVLRQKCEKEGAPDVLDIMKEEQETSRLCIEKYLNFTVLQEELQNARKTGSMDEVFARYCDLWPEMYGCLNTTIGLVRRCMDDQETKGFNKTLEIVDNLKEFMCHKEGDRLAMFVAEGGVECLQERKDGVTKCVNETLGARLPDPENFSLDTMPMLLFNSKDCQDFDSIRHCVNKELELCTDSTPANIVDALLKFLKKQMPCKSEEVTSKKLSAVPSISKDATDGSLFLTANIFLVTLTVITSSFFKL